MSRNKIPKNENSRSKMELAEIKQVWKSKWFSAAKCKQLFSVLNITTSLHCQFVNGPIKTYVHINMEGINRRGPNLAGRQLLISFFTKNFYIR